MTESELTPKRSDYLREALFSALEQRERVRGISRHEVWVLTGVVHILDDGYQITYIPLYYDGSTIESYWLKRGFIDIGSIHGRTLIVVAENVPKSQSVIRAWQIDHQREDKRPLRARGIPANSVRREVESFLRYRKDVAAHAVGPDDSLSPQQIPIRWSDFGARDSESFVIGEELTAPRG
ncbi:hypothetical protein GCM10010413_19950 [Promicromonospora sukumoe]|uniref:Uncharacterized protein n=1 Tax=Promicromonospora sukumoe TaxID=88382 RepID=A0A7W3J9J3_9MICO|nr:hypothetical protein [Promicromonospora sukumoe]MBA8808787.1 hypothetical protein [Promicromonospora sukumoe]